MVQFAHAQEAACRVRNEISLAPLTPDEAMAARPKVKLSDVKKLEAAEKAEMKGKK